MTEASGAGYVRWLIGKSPRDESPLSPAELSLFQKHFPRSVPASLTQEGGVTGFWITPMLSQAIFVPVAASE